MKALKRLFLTGLIACSALLGGAALGTTAVQSETANAEASQTYTTEDVFFMARVTNVYVPNGNFNLTISMSEYDATVTQMGYAFSKDLAKAFNEFGFFDKVKIGEKTLREYGCTGFWENAMDIGMNEPKSVINLHCHADPAIWEAAVNSGEVAFSAPSCPVTIEEGTIVPGFSYLTDGENPVVYRAAHTHVSQPKPGIAYDMETYVQVDVESVCYTTGWDATYNNAYLGISFVGDDYLGDGEETEIIDYQYNKFTKSMLINGESGKVESYGLYNLGEAGKGRYSFVIRVPETECTSITIPKGSLFQTRVIEQFREKNGHPVYIYYQTKEDVTFYKSASGEFVMLDAMREDSIATLQKMRAAKVDADYFSADVAEMNSVLETAIAEIEKATEAEVIQAAFDYAKGVLESTLPKLDTVQAAKSELDAYKAEEIYFTEADSAARLAILGEAKTAVDTAASSEAISIIVTEAKTAVDAIVSKDDVMEAKSAELNGYKAEEGYYREAEAAQRAEIVENAIASINAATTAEQMENITANAKLAIDGLTTNAEYTAAEEEIAGNKLAALAVVNAAKAEIKTWLYTQTDLTTINVLYTQVKQTIENTTDKAAMDKAAADFVAKLATILPQVKEETQEKSEGCGSVMSASAACVLFGAFAVALLAKKKEN